MKIQVFRSLLTYMSLSCISAALNSDETEQNFLPAEYSIQFFDYKDSDFDHSSQKRVPKDIFSDDIPMDLKLENLSSALDGEETIHGQKLSGFDNDNSENETQSKRTFNRAPKRKYYTGNDFLRSSSPLEEYRDTGKAFTKRESHNEHFYRSNSWNKNKSNPLLNKLTQYKKSGLHLKVENLDPKHGDLLRSSKVVNIYSTTETNENNVGYNSAKLNKTMRNLYPSRQQTQRIPPTESEDSGEYPDDDEDFTSQPNRKMLDEIKVIEINETFEEYVTTDHSLSDLLLKNDDPKNVKERDNDNYDNHEIDQSSLAKTTEAEINVTREEITDSSTSIINEMNYIEFNNTFEQNNLLNTAEKETGDSIKHDITRKEINESNWHLGNFTIRESMKVSSPLLEKDKEHPLHRNTSYYYKNTQKRLPVERETSTNSGKNIKFRRDNGLLENDKDVVEILKLLMGNLKINNHNPHSEDTAIVIMAKKSLHRSDPEHGENSPSSDKSDNRLKENSIQRDQTSISNEKPLSIYNTSSDIMVNEFLKIDSTVSPISLSMISSVSTISVYEKVIKNQEESYPLTVPPGIIRNVTALPTYRTKKSVEEDHLRYPITSKHWHLSNNDIMKRSYDSQGKNHHIRSTEPWKKHNVMKKRAKGPHLLLNVGQGMKRDTTTVDKKYHDAQMSNLIDLAEKKLEAEGVEEKIESVLESDEGDNFSKTPSFFFQEHETESINVPTTIAYTSTKVDEIHLRENLKRENELGLKRPVTTFRDNYYPAQKADIRELTSTSKSALITSRELTSNAALKEGHPQPVIHKFINSKNILETKKLTNKPDNGSYGENAGLNVKSAEGRNSSNSDINRNALEKLLALLKKKSLQRKSLKRVKISNDALAYPGRHPYLAGFALGAGVVIVFLILILGLVGWKLKTFCLEKNMSEIERNSYVNELILKDGSKTNLDKREYTELIRYHKRLKEKSNSMNEKRFQEVFFNHDNKKQKKKINLQSVLESSIQQIKTPRLNLREKRFPLGHYTNFSDSESASE